MEEFQFIDIMAGSPPGHSRWDTNAEGALHTLDAALAKAGLPGELAPALRVLDRVEQLVDAGRTERDKARHRLEAATRRLLGDGDLDAAVAEYGHVLGETAVWISDDSVGSVGLGDAARQRRVAAVMTVFGMATGLHQKLRDHCRDVVTVIAGIPAPPGDVWQTQTVAAASTAMIRAGREADWASFVRLSDEWDAIHSAARLLRETGQFQGELAFTGPAGLCVVFLGWELAVGKEELRQLPGPLRVRRAHDLGWKPGLWLKSDHDRFAAERVERDKPKRRPLLQRLWADEPAPAEAAPEFT